MSFLTRPASLLRSAALRPAALSVAPRAITRQVRFATQDYGSGEGNPAGESPQQQGASGSEHLEHPGPPPPKVARGQSSSSPNNDDSSSSSGSSKSSGQQSQSKDPAAKQGSENSKSSSETKGAQPKILDESPPSKENESEDVKQHNKEMSNRTDKAHEQYEK